MMRAVEWTQAGYVVTSWGNGLAYTVTAPDGISVFFQGDDATAWRTEYDAADASPDGPGRFLADTIADYATPDELAARTLSRPALVAAAEEARALNE